MPTMHINEQDSVEASSMNHPLPAALGGKIVSKSCPAPSACDGWEYINEEGFAQSPIFLPHLSREAVNAALEVRTSDYKCLRLIQIYVDLHIQFWIAVSSFLCFFFWASLISGRKDML